MRADFSGDTHPNHVVNAEEFRRAFRRFFAKRGMEIGWHAEKRAASKRRNLPSMEEE
jgi:hypothetical protein